MFARRMLKTVAMVSVVFVCVCASDSAASRPPRACGSVAYGGTIITASPDVPCAAARHVISRWFHERCATKPGGCRINGYTCRAAIPKSVRDALDLRAGDQVLFRVEQSRAVLAKIPDFLSLAGAVAVPAGKRGTEWSDVVRRTHSERARRAG